jgi:hypothetical protein
MVGPPTYPAPMQAIEVIFSENGMVKRIQLKNYFFCENKDRNDFKQDKIAGVLKSALKSK